MKILFNCTLARKKMYDLNLTQQNLIDFLNQNGVKTSLHSLKCWFRSNEKIRSMPDISRLVLIARLLNLDLNDLILIIEN
ncbi:hypothetical protein DMB92_09105 [Campylobacter sp. MIT 99-7217]|uniref:hypothetical protein n=1 Tax=Campylobacter sp. MIT 99-7217 TaxID=535091 RepID=UPI001159DBA6|nr:hypothetical protein [Campylobacter sp. MIT 99-7217]TQR28642.1 hypothetical protein DMB92_09105 [Campylobacter sp. MIT 99-7217]